ncbi:MAG: WS/DGAT/MGAT family O-acyltransferase [Candidatus Promineifilaceae bacterium]
MLRMIGRNAHLSPVDTAWYRMEHPTNLMMITGVFIFDEMLDYAQLRSVLEKGLLRFDRFKQKVVRPQLSFAPPYWVDDEDFDIDSHLHRISLPSPGDQKRLEAVVNDYMSAPLDYSKPLWQIHLVENFGDGCAVLCRLHHCIADGIALVRVLLDLTQDSPEAAPGYIMGTSPGGKASDNANNRTIDRKNSHFQQGLDFVSDPRRVAEAAKLGAASSTALAHLLLLTSDPPTRFKGELGVRKRCSWTEPISLQQVKDVGTAIGGTVNDVLLSTVAGALGRYLRLRGEAVGGLEFRAVVPVNLRPADEELRLGNSFGLVFLTLPVGIDDPIERIQELKRRMDAIKGTPEAIVAFGIVNAIGIASPEIEDIVVNMFGKKGTAVMTNVPGPRETRYLAGKPIKGVMFWVPQSGRLGLGVSIISYAGEVLVGIATDAGLTPDPETIVELVMEEFSAYSRFIEGE